MWCDEGPFGGGVGRGCLVVVWGGAVWWWGGRGCLVVVC